MAPRPFFDLLNALSSLDIDKFKSFEVITTQYQSFKTGDGAISTDVLIPKTLLQNPASSNCPILIRIHGGFLVTGSSRYAPWFSTWILDYATKNEAIIVSPNYRLLPEATGEDIMEDMTDLWHWLHEGGLSNCLKEAGHSCLAINLSEIVLLGESAGGYLAVQLALSYASQVKGVIAAYPMIDFDSPFYTESYSKPIVGVPNLPNSLIDDHLAAIRDGTAPKIVTEADPSNRLELAFSIVQNSRFLEFFGSDNTELFPMERLRHLSQSALSQLPPFFIFHGKQDSAVPSESSIRFYSLLRERAPDVKVRLHIQDGDHGFDVDASLDTPWLRDGLAMITDSWLKLDNKL